LGFELAGSSQAIEIVQVGDVPGRWFAQRSQKQTGMEDSNVLQSKRPGVFPNDWLGVDFRNWLVRAA
jgi:hypothetical protein